MHGRSVENGHRQRVSLCGEGTGYRDESGTNAGGCTHTTGLVSQPPLSVQEVQPSSRGHGWRLPSQLPSGTHSSDEWDGVGGLERPAIQMFPARIKFVLGAPFCTCVFLLLIYFSFLILRQCLFTYIPLAVLELTM